LWIKRAFKDSSTPTLIAMIALSRFPPCDLDRAISQDGDTSSSTNQWIGQQTRRDGIRSATLDAFVSMNIRSPVRRICEREGERERERESERHSGARTCSARARERERKRTEVREKEGRCNALVYRRVITGVNNTRNERKREVWEGGREREREREGEGEGGPPTVEDPGRILQEPHKAASSRPAGPASCPVTLFVSLIKMTKHFLSSCPEAPEGLHLPGSMEVKQSPRVASAIAS